jgi:hypothetical protein
LDTPPDVPIQQAATASGDTLTSERISSAAQRQRAAGVQNSLHTLAVPTSTTHPASSDVSSSARISVPPANGIAAEVQQQAAEPESVHRLNATTAPSSAATPQPGQVQAVTLARPQAEAPESVFSAAGQSPGDSGDTQPGHQRPATPTEQRA